MPAVNRFPSAADGAGFKPLADKLHGMGLKFGLHLFRGIPRNAVKDKMPIEGSTFTAADAGNPDPKSGVGWCPDFFGMKNNEAAQAWYDSMYRLLASWGVDYVKVDDLTNSGYYREEIEMIRKAIDRCGRPIVFSGSAGLEQVKNGPHAMNHLNLWRISGDFWDRWDKLDKQFDLFAQWDEFTGPGHFADGDMIPFGHLCIRSFTVDREHWTHFTRDEQVTLMSLWCLGSSPLMLGLNLPDNDAFTESLITNDEVLAVDQDPLCAKARRVSAAQGLEVWTKELASGSRAVGLFNRSGSTATVTLPWTDAGLAGKQTVRDLWQRKDLGEFADPMSLPVQAHSAVLLMLKRSDH
jgi:hypothetical protein